MLVHVNPSPLALLPIPSSPPYSKPLSKLAGPPPPIHSQLLLSASPFLPSRTLLLPFTLLLFPYWLLSLSTALPLAPAVSHTHVLISLCPTAKPHHLWTQVVLRKSSWWYLKDLRVGKPGGKKAELGSPSPTVHDFGGTIGVALLRSYSKKKYLAVSHGNGSQLQITVKLQLLFLSKSCLLCWIAAIILEI